MYNSLKMLCKNLTKQVKDLNNENFKPLNKEIQGDGKIHYANGLVQLIS